MEFSASGPRIKFAIVITAKQESLHLLENKSSHRMCNSSGSSGLLIILLHTLCISLVGVGFSSAEVTIPNTPAGKVAASLIESINSTDPTRLDEYYKRYDPSHDAQDLAGIRSLTGGLDLLSIESSEPLRLVYILKERNGDDLALAKVNVTDTDPPQVTYSSLYISPGATIIGFNIDAATRSRVLRGAVAMLEEFYVFPHTAKKMGTDVKNRAKRGEYNLVTDGDLFANLLTSEFRNISHDKHLKVMFSPYKAADESHPPNTTPDAEFRTAMARTNCGFGKVEVLSGNVGYIKFDFFARPDVCGSTVYAAMAFIGNVDAVIFDLRQNGGGDPAMVALLSSYLFATPTHLNDLWERKSGQTTQYWTLPYVPGKRLSDVPAYVLTSRDSFSGAEEFANNLKVLKRATIVGEITGGGAHPVSNYRIDERFMIGVPFARAINPVTNTNWEGVGVEPDVIVAASEALTTAQALASRELTKRHSAKPFN